MPRDADGNGGWVSYNIETNEIGLEFPPAQAVAFSPRSALQLARCILETIEKLADERAARRDG